MDRNDGEIRKTYLISVNTRSLRQSLVDKYRPLDLDDLILPPGHGLSAAIEFVANPYPSAWLLHGRSGLGKSSLAMIMAQAAASHPISVQRLVGPDLDSACLRHLAVSSMQPPMFGKRHAIVVDEADSIPRAAQVRLLGILDSLVHSCWIFTSNDDLDSFEARFLSRVKPQLFTAQGIYEPATRWLLSIARREGIPVTKPNAQRIVRDAKNNLRAALQGLEVIVPSSQIPALQTSLRPDGNLFETGLIAR